MPTIEIVKAWKDQEYRDTLTEEQLAELPEHPAGIIEFGQPQLEDESLFGPQAGKCKFYTNNNTNNNQCYTHNQCTTNTGQCTTHTDHCASYK